MLAGSNETVTRFIAALDRFNRAVAGVVSWGTLAMVLITFSVVVLRYALSVGWVWMQELVLYLHSAVFLLAAGATLTDDGHVRVDIFYSTASERGRAWVDLLGTLVFLIPFCALVAVQSLPFVVDSWAVSEGSPEPDGLPGVFVLKSLVLAYATLLLLAGASTALTAVCKLTTAHTSPRPTPTPPPSV
jgi:TRAP-type mannitol/chloroaromatic compound transport system permease small subunit